jgi:hypothetical protein
VLGLKIKGFYIAIRIFNRFHSIGDAGDEGDAGVARHRAHNREHNASAPGVRILA